MVVKNNCNENRHRQSHEQESRSEHDLRKGVTKMEENRREDKPQARTYQIGETIQLEGNQLLLLQEFRQSMRLAGEIFETAALKQLEAKEIFWTAFHELFPGSDDARWRIDFETGEAMVLTTEEVLTRYRAKMRNPGGEL
jgi:hypothetical protein